MDTFHLEGILRIYELPNDEALAEYLPWWQRFSLTEKANKAHQAIEVRNLITSAGRTQILTFMGNTGTTTAFAQQYAVGTGPIAQVQASDASLSTELFRAAPTSYSVVGNAVTVSTPFSSTQAVGALTNAGLWGNGATSTPGSGTLMTHVLYSYTKSNSIAIVNDYTLSLT